MSAFSAETLTLDHIVAAHTRIRGYIRHTPLAPLPHLTDDVPAGLRLKLENMQVAGSFKPRGVFNHLLDAGRVIAARVNAVRGSASSGVIAASGGNHGLAVAYAAARLGMAATVYIPATATADREARIAAWGAHVVRHGENWDDAQAAATLHAERDGMYLIHPFDSLKTLAGQGTIGLEIAADAPDADTVWIAIGGGGLIAGAAAALKARNPAVRIIGVEPEGAASMRAAVAAGRVVELPRVNTIADTLSPRAVCEATRALTAQYVETIVTVSDSAMIDAMRWLWKTANQLVEPSGAAVIAAIRAADPALVGQRPVAVICGGNAAADAVFTAYQASAHAKGTA
jgi:threonine dehydratase